MMTSQYVSGLYTYRDNAAYPLLCFLHSSYSCTQGHCAPSTRMRVASYDAALYATKRLSRFLALSKHSMTTLQPSNCRCIVMARDLFCHWYSRIHVNSQTPKVTQTLIKVHHEVFTRSPLQKKNYSVRFPTCHITEVIQNGQLEFQFASG
jgi:hypothetical protein